MRFAFGLALAALLAAALAGQGMSARIVGNVHSEDSLPLGGVLVTAVNIGNNSASTTVSGKQDGSFRLLGLAPGIYQVSFDLEGYESYTAAGISLSVEQSVTLRIKLKKTAPPDGQGVVAAEAGAREREDRRDKRDFFAERAKWSLRISFGMNYIALGDSNAFLRGFTRRVEFARDGFKTLHSGSEWTAEAGCRVTPRLELAVGLGLVRNERRGNDLINFPINYYPRFIEEKYTVDLKVKAIPVQLICRYWLASKGSRIYSVYGALLYHFASWSMDTRYQKFKVFYDADFSTVETEEMETASQRGFGFEAGGRVEWKMDEAISFVVDLSGRYAPRRNFSGRREYYPHMYASMPQVSKGELWFYEFYDQGLKRWVRDLGIGERPASADVRNVSSARVDFSGLALRFGFLLRM